jgi:hypothetical protein
VIDYGPKSSFDWSTIAREGSYEIEVTAQNTSTGQTAVATASYRLESHALARTSVITPTRHPLVFLYSASACKPGQRMRVDFKSDVPISTPYKPCRPGLSMNFYLAGMRANTVYYAHYVLDTGTELVAGPEAVFTTGYVPLKPPDVFPLTPNVPTANPVLLQSLFGTSSTATDLNGNVIWFSPGDISFLTRPVEGGTFLGIGENEFLPPSQQFVREFDLAGTTVAETNADRINQQLALIGVHPINAFHHEARKISDGRYLVLADSERILTDVQGPGPVDVIGDTILVLNSELQVIWAWDSFDHLDPHRMATLSETCAHPSGAACAAWYLSPTATDWLHGNSLQLTPDGDILYSIRHQDWVIKIDYQNGLGTDDIVWRAGKDGDLQIPSGASNDPSPWFSHQHDPNFEADNTTLTVFDDGNIRQAANPAANSRGQAWTIDDAHRTATPFLNADLGLYSPAVGSAQKLANGNYHFDSGFILDPAGTGLRVSQSLEVDPTGKTVYGIQFNTMEYRSFRMGSLYTAP